jgi:hypothetical protein
MKNNTVKDALIKRINRKLRIKQQKVVVTRGGNVVLYDKLENVDIDNNVDLNALAKRLGVKENHLLVEGADASGYELATA